MLINENLTVNGNLTATQIDGEPSECVIAAVMQAVKEQIDPLQASVADLNTAVAEKADIQAFRELAEKYNSAIEVINNLAERVAALESNYDPTVIGNVPPAIKKQGE